MKDIDIDSLKKYGITVSANEMDNGELRFRLSGLQSSYIRVESGYSRGWQNSHYHSSQTEVFFVEKGRLLLAINGDKFEIRCYREGDFFSVEPMVSHNIYMYPKTITHTVKYGGSPDWIFDQELDYYIRNNIIL